jgi:acetylornithine/succinyldiaminopimelate/putrescine aminotransferase
MKVSQFLEEIRTWGVSSKCHGLPDELVNSLLQEEPLVRDVIIAAHEQITQIRSAEPELLNLTEEELRLKLQEHLLNFYGADSVSPFVPLAARGPWIISAAGALIYDTGGYGMLGFGHNPPFLQDVLNRDQAMANVMTSSFSHRRVLSALRRSIGLQSAQGSADNCPYDQFVFMNSGSEAMEVARRIMDVRVKELTDPGARFHGKVVKSLTLNKSFHGRTTLAAQVSHSSRKYYGVLASFVGLDNLIIVAPNDVSGLEQAFRNARDKGWFIEGCYMEPVMGEGNPGLALSREFYDAVRSLSREHDALLAIDSVQAGLRAHGVLSIVDYPDFAGCDAPDVEAFSKALNAGQFPLSVLALSKHAASFYRAGIYGNTMTGNPRAADIALAVLEETNEPLRCNIREAGKIFINALESLSRDFPQFLGKAQGTGLLLSLEVKNMKVVGRGGLEEQLRLEGLNVIHGGENSLRFTPWFHCSEKEIGIIRDTISRVLSARIS